MQDFSTEDYILKYMTELAASLGDDILKNYGEIVETIAEQKIDLSEARFNLHVLEQVWRNSKNRSRLDRMIEESTDDELKGHWAQLPHSLVQAHWHLPKQVAATYHQEAKYDNDQAFKDSLSVGQEALFEAAQKYFKKPKGEFKSFAWTILKQRIKEEQSRKHPIPFKVRKKLKSLGELRDEFSYREDNLTHDIIRERMSLSEQDLESLLETEAVWGNGQDMESDVELDELENEEDASPSALAVLVNIENERLLNDAIGNLNDKEADVIRGIYYQGLSQRELAEKLELSLGVLKKNHKKALNKLKRIVDEES